MLLRGWRAWKMCIRDRYDENARRKTAAALARYGFGGDAVRRAMEAALSDQEDSGD